jgi:uncharacterized protein YjbI with pentapeptide repeats
MLKLVFTLVLVSFLISFLPISFSESVPDWVKNTAGWWATDTISETEFVNAIEFLVKDGIIEVDVSTSSSSSQGVPDWVKNTAGWWATDTISETEFVNAIEFLVKDGIINVQKNQTVENIAIMWVDGKINDEKFLVNIKSVNDSFFNYENTQEVPEQLLNNAGWVSARILSNSDLSDSNSHIHENAIKCDDCIESINQHGFRGKDFSKIKPDNTFRIFAVGGSTTFGVGVNDNETWPAYLQQEFDKNNFGIDVEIINSGIGHASTKNEVNLIKDKIAFLDPDLIIMYDGWNDVIIPIDDTFDNWKSICEFGKQNNFETIVTIQPIVGTGNRILTEQELLHLYTYRDNGRLTNNSLNEVEKLYQYVERLDELNNHCYKTLNFLSVFDYVFQPIYYDSGHTIPSGNKIIAENFFPVIKEIILEKSWLTVDKNEISDSPKTIQTMDFTHVFAANANLSAMNFEGLDLRDAIFFNTNLKNTNFNNANLEGADFRNSDLTGAVFNDANLKNTLFSFAILDGIDISQKSFIDVDLSKTNLQNADISNIDLSNRDLAHTNLSGQNLKNYDFAQTNLIGADLSNTILPDKMIEKDFRSAKFIGTDFSERIFSGSNMSFSILDGANLNNAILNSVYLIDIDFTKIQNQSLKNANLDGAAMSYSNLENIIFPERMRTVNLNNAILNNADFSNVRSIGSYYGESELRNANFQNANFNSHVWDVIVSMSPEEVKAYLTKEFGDGTLPFYGDLPEDLNKLASLYTELPVLKVVDAKWKDPTSNHLTITTLLANNFINSDLENANMKNGSFGYTSFINTNLKNADFSYADLSGSFFINATMVGANLEGAYMEGANLKFANLKNANLNGADLARANLNCFNHEICNENPQ